MNEHSLRTLTVSSRHGLANRLRMLVSGLVIADESDRRFTMYWQPTRACGCAFSELFQNQWDIKNELIPNNLEFMDLSKRKWNEFPDLLTSSDSALAVQYYGWLLQPSLHPHHARLIPRCIEVFNQIELASEIHARVQAFREQFFNASVIGVHLRRGDLVWAHPNSTNNLGVAFRSVENFLTQAPNALIFLCTDDGAIHPSTRASTRYAGIREKFIRRFGERVISPPTQSLDRGTPGAIQDALVELWLLRQTDFFVGTANSSFSELAALGRDIPVVMASHPEMLYAWAERFLRWTRLKRVIDRISIAELGQIVPFTALWFHYRNDTMQRVRRLWRAGSHQ